jgi:hypothetical protein
MSTYTADVLRAHDVRSKFQLLEGIYLLGSLQKGVTVYGQQVRAHNLIWSLWELSRHDYVTPKSIAIVGGGIAGLTAAACVISRFQSVSVTLFERQWDLCPLQQGSDTRWLHPRIYDWPYLGSRVPSASLPVLNWSEGRASDVARELLEKFGRYCVKYLDANKNNLRLYLGVSHLRVDKRKIEWMGQKTKRSGEFFYIETKESGTEEFDTIILAPGYGVELDQTTPLYWRNDQLSQPILTGDRVLYVVSGYGDGAIVDLCRLTIERFRQDTILYELFGKDIDRQEENLRTRIENQGGRYKCNLYRALADADFHALEEKLSHRLRKDVDVILHGAGKEGNNKSIEALFAVGSSILHRFLLYLLYKRHAFTISFDELRDVARKRKGSNPQLICRHGTDRMKNVLDLFLNQESVRVRLAAMDEGQAQRADQLWRPGSFPHLP